ncbi:MAG: succinate dehydrogenase iron-sulfur subunit [Deltaproteobacteria bacterium CG_4_10_14_0_2_um_filter_43_8]|nr:MAG: succinate dehydrogenase iron-sulfur subunit [Deltaproteobacteria bacterium CG11_big_fil_rev_8_21_14_0_20_42_23]PJA22037.1 MAG: succinate dehydrogenase iron-sulfur subunit [Deltaproteobacteria bacterium CG_4_10_14_0_2_um_filter_43_8]PJC64997.1 MAG: succinate dehydrogenase iron-sulfur subunit [Deltaproteobacteria bacterium CG_4_9_14_0_2_um_filter_42_21]
MSEFVHVKIKRQDGPDDLPYWEDFHINYKPHMNVITLLQEIQRNPINADGLPTTPVASDYSCLEEVCGSCTMNINGRVRQACTALVDHLDHPITLEPMKKFPTVRDLVVDRSSMFEALKKVNAWVRIDGTFDKGAGPKMSSEKQQKAYEFSRCMMCGCCCEVCPQFNDRSPFMGPFVMAHVNLLNHHPVGEGTKAERLDALMGPGGIADCGNAQNCVKACPKEIPLTDAIATLGWDTTKHALKKIFKA